MALELAYFEDRQVVIVHQAGCRVFTTVLRRYQVEPVVQPPPDWKVARCTVCFPTYGVVMRERRRITVLDHNERRIPDRFRVHGEPTLPVEAVDVHVQHRAVEWRAMANCRTTDERLQPWLTWLWTTEHYNRRWPINLQRQLCNECPVRAECLEQGVWDQEPWGVWGGTTPKERKKLLKKWLLEGRVDERTDGDGRPGRGGAIRSPHGSWFAATGTSDRSGASPGESADTITDQELSELPLGVNLSWPRSHLGSRDGWSGTALGGRRSAR